MAAKVVAITNDVRPGVRQCPGATFERNPIFNLIVGAICSEGYSATRSSDAVDFNRPLLSTMAAPGMKASKKELHKYEIAYEKRRREKINAASYIGDIPKDVLADFPPAFCRFARNGLDIDLVFTSPEHPSWTKDIEDAIFQLTKTNMQALYDAAPGWSWADGKKRSETRHSDTRYILARNREDAAIVAFAAFRFIMEDDYDVVYLYELQLGPGVQRKGLGKLLMQLVELTAKKNGMQWFVGIATKRERFQCVAD